MNKRGQDAATPLELDQYRRKSRAGAARWPACPRKRGLVVVDRATGSTIPARCDRLACFACIVPMAIQTAEALALARPNTWITLTQLRGVWAECKTKMQRFAERLQTTGVIGEHAYHLEPNPRSSGVHAHVWWQGDPLQLEYVADAARSARMGEYFALGAAEVPTEAYARPALEYGLKMILQARPGAPTLMWPEAERYLELNGGRLVHASRGFWRDRQGNPLGGLKAARREARRLSSGRWTLEAA